MTCLLMSCARKVDPALEILAVSGLVCVDVLPVTVTSTRELSLPANRETFVLILCNTSTRAVSASRYRLLCLWFAIDGYGESSLFLRQTPAILMLEILIDLPYLVLPSSIASYMCSSSTCLSTQDLKCVRVYLTTLATPTDP